MGQYVGEVVMSRVALFPGQGAQSVGMCRDFIDSFTFINDLFDQASDVLSRDLKKICLEGPEEALNATDICQSALFVSSYAIFKLMERELGWTSSSYDAMAGLSLGEITALAAAGSLDFASGVQLVSHRGRFMQEACDREPSSMLSAIGLNKEEVSQIAKEVAGDGVLVVANVNAPSQMVLSGHPALLEKAAAKCKEKGARAIPLKVAGAFHSPCMKPADTQLKEFLETLEIKAPEVPVYRNVDGQPHGSPEEIKEKLSLQVVASVQWVDCMNNLSDESQAYEIGAGKVLTGLMRKINRNISVTPINKLEDFNALKQQGASV